MNEILIIIGLILLNGVFSMSEVAMISARKSRLSTEAKKGSKAAQKALDLSGNPDKFLSTVQIGITMLGYAESLDYGPIFAAIVIVLIPFLAVFILMHRRIMASLRQGYMFM